MSVYATVSFSGCTVLEKKKKKEIRAVDEM